MASSRKASLSGLAFAVVVLAVVVAPSLSHSSEPEFVPGEIIVKLKGSAKTLKAQAFIGKAVSEQAMSLKGSWSGLNMHHFKLNDASQMQAKINELKADPDVEYAEPNYVIRLSPAVSQDDSVLSMAEARAMNSSMSAGGEMQGALAQTNAPIQLASAWSAETPGRAPIIVAIIDTGLDLNHEIFRDSGALWVNSREIPNNGVDDDGNGYVDDVNGWNFSANNKTPMDDDGHGTHVGGIVLGATQDILAYPIQAAGIRIMPLKFLDASGMGTTSDAVRAIYYAVNNGARVLNNSWGGGGYSNSLLDAIAFAYAQRAIFIAAAGNSSVNNDISPTYPASYSVPGILSVAATTDSDTLASYSNYGAASVHLGSPGSSIWSSLPNQSYGRSSGTSMATPFVSGIAALILRENPNLSAYQAKQIILSGAQSIASLQTKTISRSRLNAYNSVVAAKAASGEASQPAYVATSRGPASEEASGAVGCGLVKALINDASGPRGPRQNIAIVGLILLFAAPLLIAFVLRRKSGVSRRRFPRYQISSQVKMSVGGRELTGEVSSISMGGVQLAVDSGGANGNASGSGTNPDSWLENGGVVSMTIKSPDGREEIRVAGKVVWAEEKKRYGVAFEDADSSVLNSIGRWTNKLLKV